jgi:uncharacterized membrane protein
MSVPVTQRSEVPAHREPLLPVNVSQDERLLSALAGAGLVAVGLMRRGLPGLAAGAAGAALLGRGASGRCAVYRAMGIAGVAPSRLAPIEVARAVTIAASVEEIRDALRSPERWLTGGAVEEAIREGDRWRLAIRALGVEHRDVTVELRDESDHVFAFVARRGEAGRAHEGRITFTGAPGALGTEVRASIAVQPEGRVGATLARALEGVAARALGHALGRLRQVVETGETARTQPQPHAGRGVPALTVRVAAKRKETAA